MKSNLSVDLREDRFFARASTFPMIFKEIFVSSTVLKTGRPNL
jgi:hypothetical protein